MADNRKDCCKVEANLVVIEDQPHVLVKRCTVCACRHFRARVGAQPGAVQVTGTPLRDWKPEPGCGGCDDAEC